MKKTYTYPKIETKKLTSEDPAAAFAINNFNSKAIVQADNNAVNIINF